MRTVIVALASMVCQCGGMEKNWVTLGLTRVSNPGPTLLRPLMHMRCVPPSRRLMFTRCANEWEPWDQAPVGSRMVARYQSTNDESASSKGVAGA